MKYTLAYSNKHNCTNVNGHYFTPVQDKAEIEEIRRQHPRLVAALWKCMSCGKVIASM